jgi:hypothetical protein
MSFVFKFRQGIGLDIEYNEDICHIVTNGEDEQVVAFCGVLLKLPFLTIYIGDFFDLEDTEQVK